MTSPVVPVRCPCGREHGMPADAAPHREADRGRVLCPSCAAVATREVWLPTRESSEALLAQLDAASRRRDARREPLRRAERVLRRAS